MNFLSVCSGIEAASVAWKPIGFHCVGLSEIEPFPVSVLKHHYPDFPLYGDFTQIDVKEIEQPVNILVGGTPCQSFSVAGLRGGLDDDRGNLALQFCRLALKARPDWVLWENVPGVLSSWSDDPDHPPTNRRNGVENVIQRNDFDSFLAGLAECGYGFAWRILDAQYVRVQSHEFAVPQRRRRVFVVGCLGDWRRAAAVLFEREGLQGHSPPRRKKGERIAGTISSRATGGGGLGTDFEIDGGVVSAPLTQSPYGDQLSKESHLIPSMIGTAHCLNAGAMGRIDYESETLVTEAVETDVPWMLHSENSNASKNGVGPSKAECARSLDSNGGYSHSQGGNLVSYRGVRRLTPRECERLQGFPDDYTVVSHRGKSGKDGPRYKALGNSMAVNVMRWLGERIKQVHELEMVGGK